MKAAGIAMMAATLLSGLSAAPSVLAQSSGRHVFGPYVGFTDRRDTDITLGAEYEYRLRPRWSVGGVLEYTPDAFGSSDATLVLGTVNFRPVDRLKLIGGVGVEFTDFDDDVRFRLGAGYDVLEAERIVLMPRFAVDFGDRDESLSFGATLGFTF